MHRFAEEEGLLISVLLNNKTVLQIAICRLLGALALLSPKACALKPHSRPPPPLR